MLAAVEQHDLLAAAEANEDLTDRLVEQVMKEKEAARPGTGGGIRRAVRAPQPALSYEQMRALEGRDAAADAAAVLPEERPRTTAVSSHAPRQPPQVPAHGGGPLRSKSSAVLPPSVSASTSTSTPASTSSSSSSSSAAAAPAAKFKRPYADVGGIVAPDTLPLCRIVQLNMLDTWGDPYYAGLTGLQVMVAGDDDHIVRPVPLDRSMLDASPLDINQAGFDGDQRTLDKLVNGVNVTTVDVNMWLIPYTPGDAHTLTIDLGAPRRVYGLRVWNYNKTLDDTMRGVRRVTVTLDGVRLRTPADGDTVTLRRAWGTDVYDFGQDVVFRRDDKSGEPWFVPPTPNAAANVPERARNAMTTHSRATVGGVPFIHHSLRQDYEPPLYPRGSTFKFVLVSSAGDPYYIGLDGLALYDAVGKRLPLHPSQVHAVPGSVNDLRRAEGRGAGDKTPPPAAATADPRLPGNLARKYNPSTWTPADAWLAPLAHSLTPGDRNLLVVTFHQPVVLSMIKVWNYSKTPARGVAALELWVDGLLVMCTEVQPGQQTLLFCTDPTLIAAERHHLHYCGTREQDVMCVDEQRVVVASKALHTADPTAEGVVADLDARPTTSLVG